MFASHFEWRWYCGPTRDRFGKSWIYQLLPIVSEKLEGQAIIVIMLRRQQNSVCVLAHLGVHNDPEIMEGKFSLIFGSPESWILNPKWRAMLSSTLYQHNLVAIVVDEHMSHTNGGFAYTGLVINFNWLIYYDISSFEMTEPVQTYIITKTLCDWLTGTPWFKWFKCFTLLNFTDIFYCYNIFHSLYQNNYMENTECQKYSFSKFL